METVKVILNPYAGRGRGKLRSVCITAGQPTSVHAEDRMGRSRYGLDGRLGDGRRHCRRCRAGVPGRMTPATSGRDDCKNGTATGSEQGEEGAAP